MQPGDSIRGERPIRTAAVHYDDAPRPGKLVERASDIWRLINCNDERRETIRG